MDQISKAAEFISELRFTLQQTPQIPETLRPANPAAGYASRGVVAGKNADRIGLFRQLDSHRKCRV